MRLTVDLAIPCGLIVNELVTNSLKHAFPGARSGRLEVRMEEPSKGRLVLEVADDGVGIPGEIDLRNTRSLGLDLVFTFAEQIEAEVEVERQGGTRFVFSFANTGGN